MSFQAAGGFRAAFLFCSLAAVQKYSEGNGDRIKKTPERFRSL